MTGRVWARRVQPSTLLWALALAMGVIAAVLHAGLAGGWARVDVPTTLAWWMLAALFAAAEMTVINVQIYRDSHSLSLTEIPLVLGLLLASPIALIIGRLVGSAVALGFRRQQTPIKLAFNLTLFYLETTLSLVVFRAVLGSGRPLDPVGWLATLAGVSVMVVLGLALVITAIRLNDTSKSLGALLRVVPVSVILSLEAAFFGLLAALALAHSAWTALILFPTGAVLIAILRSYGVLLKRHSELRAVHDYVQEGESEIRVDDAAVAALVSGMVEAVKASDCSVVVMGGDEITVHRRAAQPAIADPDEFAPVVAEIGRLTPLRAAPPGPAAAAAFDTLGMSVALLVPIELEDGMAAILLGPPAGQDSAYAPSDLDLIETLAASAAARLRRIELVSRLKDEIEARQEIIRSKDQLVASVSHELRTPMTSVLGFADLLRAQDSGLTEADRQQMLQAIVDEALGITNIVEDLLTVARSEAGTLAVNPQAVDLLAEAESVLGYSYSRSNADIELIGEPTPAIADPHRVKQVVRNIVVNAQRYGGPTIRVEVGSAEGTAFVRVVDDGDGVSPEVAETMFEPYVRTWSSRSQPAAVGLGLTISLRLAHLMGGDVTYRREGEETVFEFTVPITARLDSAA